MLALMLFAGMDTTSKYLAERLPVPVIVAGRYIVHTALMLAVLAPVQGRQLFQTQRTGWVLARGVTLAVASLFMGLALQRMPVAEATAIVYLSPLVVVVLAGRLLGEKVGASAWWSVGLGFAGVLCIARPGGQLDPWGLVFALCNMSLAATYQLLSRSLSRTERTVPMLFYSAMAGAVIFGVLLPWQLQGVSPSLQEWAWLVALGAGAGLGHYLYTAAFRQAPASVLAPLSNLQMVWAGLLGWWVFAHIPDGWALLGMGLIAAAGALTALRVRQGRAGA